MISGWWVKVSLAKLNSQSCILISGGSGVGETHITKQILGNGDGMFKVPPRKIFICYSTIFDEIKYKTMSITFHHILPDEDVLNK